MSVKDIYIFSWFANLTYVNWDKDAKGLSNKPDYKQLQIQHEISNSNDAKRISGNLDDVQVQSA